MSEDTLKPEDVREADLVIGAFRMTVRRKVFDDEVPIEQAKTFEVLLSEVRNEMSFYVHLVDDPRFDLFGPIVRYERGIVEADLPPFNAYVHRKHMLMPTWHLTRHAVARLHARCLELTPKKPKKKGRS